MSDLSPGDHRGTLISNVINNNSNYITLNNIRHLKRLGHLRLVYLAQLYTLGSYQHRHHLPHIWKLVNISYPLTKQKQLIHFIYRHFFSTLAKTLEKLSTLLYITNNIPHITTQHGYKKNILLPQHYTP